MIPQTVIWVLIEKVVALIVPAAAAVMLIIQALQAAWGSLSRILQAVDAFVGFLKGVRWGNAGPLFGKAIAAGAVAVIEFISQFLLQRLMGATGAVAGKLRALARRIGSALTSVGRGAVRGAKFVVKGIGVGARRGQAAVVDLGSRLGTSLGQRARSGLERLTGRAGSKQIRPGHEFATAKAFTVMERDGTKAVRYGPMNPGPLEAEVGETFRSASYTARTLGRPIDLHRAYSDPDRKLGPYWSRTPPSGPLQVKIDSAILDEYGNEATKVVHIQVPQGETVFEGYVAQQRMRLGGGNQVYLLRLDPTWEVK
jgi:hypothetical protein